MAAVAQPADQVSDMLQSLKVDTANKPGETNSEAPPSQDGNSSDGSADASASGGTGDAASNNGAHEGVIEPGVYYAANGYAPHGYVYEYPHGVAGFEGPVTGEWDEYARFVGVDGVEIPAQGVYGENGSVLYHHPGYGFASQPAYGPYNPGAPIPTMGADGQLYGPQAFQYPGHMYQQPVSPGGQYMSTPTSMAGDAPTSGPGEPGPPGVEGGNGTMANGSNVSMGPRPGYPVTLIPSHGPYARGVLPLAIHNPQDIRNYEGLRAGAPSWADVTKITEGQQRPGVPAMHVVSQPLSAPGIPSQSMRPITPMQLHISGAPQQRSHSIASPTLGPGALARGYPPLGRVMQSPNGSGRGGRGMPGSGMDSRSNGGRGWIGVDKGKPRGGRGAGPLGNGSGNLDILNEQNRGPRTTRIRSQRTTPGVLRHTRGQGAGANGSNEALSAVANRELYNRPDFQTKYDQAKFFVIKSYSEDDVHKSIKYNVWASTPNGNKRLEGAYQDAQTRQGPCPVFFFFSVNASGQFCGVAEMTGPVDFNKSVDYWQQDKWNGRFPVKWHIIKDIPNCQFRHIILENNDNKPVTNSRDTQEVKFEQGVEMLNIFKSYASKTSILDDFQFYESRQRAMQEKRARQQAQQLRELQRQQGGGRAGNEPEQTRSEQGRPQLLQPTPAESMQLQQPKAPKLEKPAETVVEDNSHGKGGGSAEAVVSSCSPAVEGASTASLQKKSSSKSSSSETKEETVAASDNKSGDLQTPEESKDIVVANETIVDDKLVKEQKPSTLE
ncbi:YTH domain-containing family protein [Marchantia polymorpha subsp. ruderalis]|uniref:YTH domain-containing protein n=4 Tax=Marchantia polymorpha TaxID=3197 RepID=A0AAF6AJV1_MARPO|nr:hypothetical protein MARPO_0103s0072 [Marchantia polymorpha]BBM96721.1 hypothetical protein Mp_1g00140 [Marchantia polymorpha subsp. ruderalis]|eukprot:PTQ32106.1 hypothetical protein MARPO_0103s0072 [Marchantia polymorpha]